MTAFGLETLRNLFVETSDTVDASDTHTKAMVKILVINLMSKFKSFFK